MKAKRVRAIIACALVSVIALSSITGCGGQKTEEKAGKSAEKEGPVELSWLPGQTTAEVDDNAEVVKEIEKRFDIDLKGWYVDSKNFEENVNVRFAGGEMPDVMVLGNSAMLAQYVEGGIVAELPIELIREKAPNYAKAIDAIEEGNPWGVMNYNGKNYGVVNTAKVYPMAMIWRKDWLDKLNLEVPETLEEYEKVLTAFVEKDPDGDGQKDTAGIAERAFGAVFGAFGLRCVTGGIPGFTVEEMQLGEDNVPFFPYIRPEAKEALAVLNDWYEKGIIDKEFITGENHGGYAWYSHSFMNDRIGLTSAQPTHYLFASEDTSDEKNWAICMKELKGLNPEADIVFGPAPVGPEGKSGTEAWSTLQYLTCLTTQAASDPRKVDKFLEMLDAYYTDVEYMKLSNLGIEGKHYEMTESGPVRLMDGAELRKEGVLQCSFGATTMYAEEITPQRDKFCEAVTGNGYYRVDIPAVKEFTDVIATLDTLTEQAYFDIISGEKPLDYFDTFVEEFKNAGGEEAEKAVQKAYAEQMKSVEK